MSVMGGKKPFHILEASEHQRRNDGSLDEGANNEGGK